MNLHGRSLMKLAAFNREELSYLIESSPPN
jgi:hypothetical protein